MFDLLDSGQYERRIAVGGGRDVHPDGPLVARNAGRPRGVDLSVENVVVVGAGVEHQHLLRGHPHVVGDVRQVLQAHVEVEASAVALGVEHRDVRSLEAVVLHRQHRFGHRVGDLREIDPGFQPRDTDLAGEFSVAALSLQDRVRRGDALLVEEIIPRQNRVEQPHVRADATSSRA